MTNFLIFLIIEVAGGSRTIIDKAAVNATAGFCQGAPRIINNVMTNSLILGAQMQKVVIDTEIILSTSNNLSLG